MYYSWCRTWNDRNGSNMLPKSIEIQHILFGFTPQCAVKVKLGYAVIQRTKDFHKEHLMLDIPYFRTPVRYGGVDGPVADIKPWTNNYLRSNLFQKQLTSIESQERSQNGSYRIWDSEPNYMLITTEVYMPKLKKMHPVEHFFLLR